MYKRSEKYIWKYLEKSTHKLNIGHLLIMPTLQSLSIFPFMFFFYHFTAENKASVRYNADTKTRRNKQTLDALIVTC